MTSVGAEQLEQAGSLPQIFGRYLLVSRLSRGGMGEIFLARYGLSGFEKLVVIKKVLPQLSADPEFSRRFIDEASVAVKLQHANIAQVYEVGRVGDEYFLAMEYIEGRDLRRTLSLLSDSGRALPPDLALFIARDVANGLAYAHRRTDLHGDSLELVHCDISPPNIMMSFEGETKIIDFGIAKSALRAGTTDAKRGFGKFGYMSPEQLIRGRKVDFRTDIYATGVILYEMLTGQRLYMVGDTPDYRALARMVSKGQHPLPSTVDPKLSRYDDLVARALRPSPDDRYPSAAVFRDTIQQALVEVNPAFSPDQLGAFMRYMFAEEVLDQREKLRAIDHTDLEQFRHELSEGASLTVSFAFAGDAASAPSTGAEHDTASEVITAAISDTGASREVNAEIVTDEISRQRPIDERPRSSRRTGALIGALIGMLAFAGLALAMKMLEGDRSDGSSPAPASTAPVVDRAEPSSTEPRVTPIEEPADPEPVAEPVVDPEPVPDPDLPDAVSSSDPAPVPRLAPPSRSRSKKRTSARDRRRSDAPSASQEPAALSADAVQAKFRSVKREYNQFKKQYGARLETEWNDLASLATFSSGPDKLRAIDREIKRFRSKMRAVRGGS